MTTCRIPGPRSAVTLLALSAILAACTSATTPSASTPVESLGAPSVAVPVRASASASASASAEDTSSPSAAAAEPTTTAVPTAIDPCQLMPAAEASTLAKASFAAGKESTTSGNARICTYGGNTPNVLTVEVAIAPDVATAQAQKAAAEAQIKASAAKLSGTGVKITELPAFASGADAILMEAVVSLAGRQVGGRAIYVLRGTTFFGFSDLVLDAAPPSADAVKAEAMTLLGRLP